MSEEIKPKKERKFLKTLGKIGMILLEEVILKIGSAFIKKIGGKKTLPSILFLLLSFASYAAVDSIPYPFTGNKQRLGFQTTGNGLVYRGRSADTITKPSSYVDKNVKAYLLLDSVRGTIFVWRQTYWDSILVGGGATSFDTSTLNLVNRFDLKLNISDTAAMLLPYATKSYVDTANRFYARQDYLNVDSSTLTWTQTDTLVPSGVNVVMVYRNGQILLTSQYTIPTKTSVVIAATSFKVGENYTVIFLKGGGGGGGGGSGSVTSISQGTGIIVTPNPIVSTGTIEADLTVLMELSDTVSLSNRINTKLTATDTASLSSRINLKLTATDTASLSSRINLKLNSADTASLSNRINLKGTVSNIATGYGITGGAITTTGTLVLDSAVVFSQIRDSIVDIAIGNDTIKIIKQEYAPALSSVLTFTVLPKFPIQLKAFILVFRNGQLLNNEQYNLTDTNQITIVSNSFKLGSNYTVVTVSGIGSVGTGVFPNPEYPEAGIALSTGSAWASSIPNNSANWNIAFNDKIANAAFTGTTTKTLTLTQTDGGTFTPTFTDLQGVTGVTAGTGLTGGTISTTGTVAIDFGIVAPLANPTFTGTVSGITKSMVGLGNVDNTSDVNKPISTATQTALNGKQNTLTNPVTGTGTTNTLPLFTGASIIGNSVIQESSGNIGIGTSPIANLTFDVNKNILLKSGNTGIVSILFSETGTPSATDVEFGGILRYNGDLDRMELLTRDNLGGSNVTNTGLTMERVSGNIGLLKPVSMSSTLAVTGAITEGGNNVLTNLDTASLSSRIDLKLNKTDTASLSSRIDLKLNKTDTASLSSRIDLKLNKIDTASLSSRIDLKLNKTDTASLSSRIDAKYNSSGGTISGAVTMSDLSGTGTRIITVNPAGLLDDATEVSIANGGTGANSASVARTTLGVGYVFAAVTDGTAVVLSSNRVSIVNTGGLSTTTIDLTPATNGRQYMIKNLATGTVVSASSNVIPFTGGSAGTAILSAGNVTPQWVTLVADGTNWHIMQSN